MMLHCHHLPITPLGVVKLSCGVLNRHHRHYLYYCRQISSCASSSTATTQNQRRDSKHCLSKQQTCRFSSSQTKTTTPPVRHQRLTISTANHLLHSHQLTPQQLCQHSYNLAHFGEHSLHLNAYVKILPLTDILQQAQRSQERIESGQSKGLLDGIPVTIKANIAVGRWWMMPHSSSAILMNHNDTNYHNDKSFSSYDDEEAVYESDIAKRLLKECGAVLIGITNMDEFGMGSLGLNSGVLYDDRNNNVDDGENVDYKQTTQQRRLLDKKQYSCPIYNPLPWMNRLSKLQSHNHPQDNDDPDKYWIELIQNSTIHNPHGIRDEAALEDLLDEVRYWTQPPPTPSHSNPKFDNNNNNNISDTATSDYNNYSTLSTSSSSPLLSTGGSSSGSATSIAHGSSLLSIGTDTGGSLRLPAAWTSTVGFKPSYGTWSRYGVVSYASSLDTVGFVAGSVECARIGWECLSGCYGGRGSMNDGGYCNGDERSCVDSNKSRDATARVYHDERYAQQLQQPTSTTDCSKVTKKLPLAGIRIGIPSAFSLHETPPLIAKSWSAAANALQNVGGATLVPIPESELSSEWIKLSCAAYYVLACAEASSNLSRYDGVRFGLNIDLNEFAKLDNNAQEYEKYHALSDMTALEEKISTTRVLGFGDEVQRRVLAGTSVLSSDRFHTHYEAAAVVRAKVSQSIERTFRSTLPNNGDVDDDHDKVDVMLVPTALSFPCTLNPKLGDRMTDDVIDSTAAFGNDVMTIPISLGGFPSISVPFATTNHDDGTDRQEKDVVGLQVFGMRGSEDMVLQVANAMDNHSR